MNVSKGKIEVEENGNRSMICKGVFLAAIFLLLAIIVQDLFNVNDSVLYWLVCIMISVAVYSYILLFDISLRSINKSLVGIKALLITTLVFLLIPFIIWYQKEEIIKKYLSERPIDGKIYAIIYRNIEMITNNHLGNDFKYYCYIDEKEISIDDIQVFEEDKPFNIKTVIIERDSIPDTGEVTSSTYKWIENNNFAKNIFFENKIHIDENGGRGYPDAYADFLVSYRIERVLPPGYNDIEFLVSDYNPDKDFAIFLIWVEVGIIICTLCCIINDSNQKKKKEKIKQNAFEAGREAFIERIKGTTIREIAEVPINISFVNGWPKDNNNSTYGSYTVYLSKNGKKFHEKKGCCSARYSVNYIKVLDDYSPCLKCCRKTYVKPQWFIEYTKLMQEAKKYGIVIPEEN